MTDPIADDWTQPETLSPADRLAAEALIVDVEGFEGPLDLLLTLSRTQKVDLRRISVLDLAEQYLGFVERARTLRIELAADYLVMAAWLAFLKSRCSCPRTGGRGAERRGSGGASGLSAGTAAGHARGGGAADGARRLGRDFFARGLPESVALARTVTYDATLLDLMRAYARIRTKDEFRPFVMDREHVFTLEQALERMRGLIGYAGDWADLTSFLPEGWNVTPMARRSATAAHFAAVLELAKRGQVAIRQGETFAPIQIRRRAP